MPRNSDFDMLVAFRHQLFTQLPSLEKQLSDQVECQKTLPAGHPTHIALFRAIGTSHNQIRLMGEQLDACLLTFRTPALEALGLDEEARSKFGEVLDLTMMRAVVLYHMGIRCLNKLAIECSGDWREKVEQCRRLRSECNLSSREEVESLKNRYAELIREQERCKKWSDDVLDEFIRAFS